MFKTPRLLQLREQGRGSDYKIKQEFCLWSARTQLPQLEWRWESMSQAKVQAAGPRVAFTRCFGLFKLTILYRLTDLTTLHLSAGASTVSVTHVHTHSYTPLHGTSHVTVPGLHLHRL